MAANFFKVHIRNMNKGQKMKMKLAIVSVLVLPLAACIEDSGSEPGLPAVGTGSDLSSFEGARAGQSEMGIQQLGYELVRTEGLTAYWVNRSTGACARIVTSDGRYSSVTNVPYGDC